MLGVEPQTFLIRLVMENYSLRVTECISTTRDAKLVSLQ